MISAQSKYIVDEGLVLCAAFMLSPTATVLLSKKIASVFLFLSLMLSLMSARPPSFVRVLQDDQVSCCCQQFGGAQSPALYFLLRSLCGIVGATVAAARAKQ